MNTSMEPSRVTGDAVRTWTSIRRLTVTLGVVWLSLSVGMAWFARDLYTARGNDFPTGVWFVVQGSLLGYVMLIIIYVVACERIEAAAGEPPETVSGEAASKAHTARRP